MDKIPTSSTLQVSLVSYVAFVISGPVFVCVKQCKWPSPRVAR